MSRDNGSFGRSMCCPKYIRYNDSICPIAVFINAVARDLNCAGINVCRRVIAVTLFGRVAIAILINGIGIHKNGECRDCLRLVSNNITNTYR